MGNEKANLLLVDDNPANLLALAAVLEDLGHNLVQARSGEEALRQLRERDFAVVLLDVRMEGLDGFETARRIRGGEDSRPTPIIFLTAHDSPALVEEAYALGAVDYLVTPVAPVVLRAKVAGFVELFEKTEEIKRQAEQLRQAERRDFEQKLAAENDRFRALTEHSSDAVSLVSADGTILYSSPSSRRVLGYEPDEFLGRSGFELVHPDDRERIAGLLAGLARNPGGAATAEMRARHKDGSWRWVECVGTNLLAVPAVGAIVVNFRDISERRRATEALHESEGRLRMLSDNLPGGAVYQIVRGPDDQGRFTYISAGIEAMLGITPAEVLADSGTVYGLIHEEDRARVRDAEEAAHNNAAPFDCEFRQWTRSGELIWVHCRSAPRRLPSGETAWEGVVLDVTARRQAEDEMRQRAEEIAKLMDLLPLGVFIAHDPTCRRITGNRAGYEMLRLPPGSNLSLTAPPGETPPFKAFRDGRELPPEELPMQYVTARGVDVRGAEVEHVYPDGTASTLYGSASPLFDAAGNVRGCVAAFLDITERKRAEEALKEANRRKDEFLAMLAHELRNPLAPIRNALHILRLLGLPNPNLQRARDLIDRQVGHLTRLVHDLLDVSRITRGKITLRQEPVDVATVVTRAVETSRPLIEANRHTVTVTLPPEPVRVVADATRLEQVFANLLNNAAKYTERGGSISVAGERQGGEVLVRVRDTGFGIPPQVLPHVFDLFTQADRTLDRAQGGLGIGLTLVKTLVELHGGSVTAHSDGPGQGSEFVVRLPVAPGEAGRPPAADESPTVPPERSRPVQVLIVDDNQDVTESLAMLLRLWGHEVRTAADGMSGLKAARAARPDIVFLDIGLPGLDGFAVARQVRDEFGPGLRLVAMTGYGQEEDRRRSHEAGFDLHLTKPVDPAALESLLAGLRPAT